jgi:intracellular septation protein
MKFLFDLFPVIFFFATLKVAEKWHGASILLGNIFTFLGISGTVKPDLVPILLATIAAILATILQVAWVKFQHGKVDKMLWLSLSLIVVFGGLTLYFKNDTFIKWKPTILYWLMGITLLISNFFFKKNHIKTIMEEMLEVPETIWSKLNLAWAFFLISLGFLNLYVAFHYSRDTWASFKLFGVTSMMFVFVIAQTLLLRKYLIEPVEIESAEEDN